MDIYMDITMIMYLYIDCLFRFDHLQWMEIIVKRYIILYDRILVRALDSTCSNTPLLCIHWYEGKLLKLL